MLVLVGVLQPLVPLLVQNFTRTVEIAMEWPKLPTHWEISIYIYIIL
jgi:hypothetical protein